MRNLANGHISLFKSAGLRHLETQQYLGVMETGLGVNIEVPVSEEKGRAC